MNATFSPAKLKEIMPYLKICSDRLVEIINKNANNELNFSEHIDRMTMDAVFNCLFGVEVDIQNDPDNSYLLRARVAIRESNKYTPLFKFFSK
jgi:hypothetical protein